MTEPTTQPLNLDARAEIKAFIETGACQITQDPANVDALLDAYRAEILRETENEIAAAIDRNRAEHPDSDPMITRRLGMRAAERIVRGMREDTEETHVVADDSSNPDPCSGCRYVPCADCAAVSAARRP
ncbi:hypothetical protein [Streptomyces sp. NPDC014793]|uniref:hypothetical protein n=1 Tax=Streptomyces sp. NPDC014793 TaxID=3364914 RepID=UPI003701A95B